MVSGTRLTVVLFSFLSSSGEDDGSGSSTPTLHSLRHPKGSSPLCSPTDRPSDGPGRGCPPTLLAFTPHYPSLFTLSFLRLPRPPRCLWVLSRSSLILSVSRRHTTGDHPSALVWSTSPRVSSREGSRLVTLVGGREESRVEKSGRSRTTCEHVSPRRGLGVLVNRLHESVGG